MMQHSIAFLWTIIATQTKTTETYRLHRKATILKLLLIGDLAEKLELFMI
ncbi:hypothetical protein [Bacillus sp. UNC41MFS5]|nr:hypothetical protein [Bacillus sp. UNC41MFS5]